MNTTVHQPPALDHDASFGAKLNANMHLERRIVWNLLLHLQATGFALHSIFDGEENIPVTDPKAAMELIFNLDEAVIHVMLDGHIYAVVLILGNGIDIISDYSWTADPERQDFCMVMEHFDAEDYT